MGTGHPTGVVVEWGQTRIDGRPADTPDVQLDEGSTWAWQGQARTLKGDGAALMLIDSRDHIDLRHRAERGVRKLMHDVPADPTPWAADAVDPVYRDAFVVSDGTRFYTVVPISTEGQGTSLAMFPGDVPPADRNMTVVATGAPRKRPVIAEAAPVVCFTPGTLIRTNKGQRRIETLRAGDLVQTRDRGFQPIVWIGSERMSGARLHAYPQQRPVRIRKGALGPNLPYKDLLVSPDHRVLVAGAAPRTLWHEPEVLVRACDLFGHGAIMTDHVLRETAYIHLLFERHEVILANGVASETFHPAEAALSALPARDQATLFAAMPQLETHPDAYGPPARRVLSGAEAAILLDGCPTREPARPPLQAGDRAHNRISH